MHPRTTAWRVGLLGCAICLLVCSCSTTSATGSSSGAARSAGSSSTVSSSGGASTGTYTPAAGTDTNGALFETYTNKKLHFHMLIPGGWKVSNANGIVRIAKLGNVIVIASRPGKFPPKPKGVDAALQKQVKKHAILDVLRRPRSVTLPHAGKAVRVVFSKNRPATDTAPEATVIVARYLLSHSGRIVILSMQSPDTRHNLPVYDLLAESIAWDKSTKP
ncbi:MAG TPA: hypothetical protein VFH74_05040 [Gaiellales bacterium]|nr:hypothetical protein [Gaiellales bacterium]